MLVGRRCPGIRTCPRHRTKNHAARAGGTHEIRGTTRTLRSDGDLGWPDAVAHARGRSIDIEESNELPIHTDTRAMTGTGRNPWVAVDVSTDPVAHARVLARAHERSLAGAETPVGVRDLVADSWKRSLAAGVAPEAIGPPVVLSDEELERARERSPLAPAIDAILDTLSSLDAEARHVVAIGDADGDRPRALPDRRHLVADRDRPDHDLPAAGADRDQARFGHVRPAGVAADVVDERTGESVQQGQGLLVLKRPWPGMLRTLYGDDDRYVETYWSRFGPETYLVGDRRARQGRRGGRRGTVRRAHRTGDRRVRHPTG